LREYIANGLLATTSLALLGFFGCIWVEGSHYIQEPNIIILIAETASIAAIFGFALYNLICYLKRLIGSMELSNYVGVDTSCNGPHIGFYISGGKDLTLLEVNAVAEIVAKATGGEVSLVSGVAVPGAERTMSRSLAKAYIMGSPQQNPRIGRCEPMPVEYLATISLPDEGWDVNALSSNAAGGLQPGLLLLFPHLGARHS